MTDILIEAAQPHQADKLSKIAVEAKSYWGYSPEQIEQWRPEFLTITSEYIEGNHVWVAVSDTQELTGFAAITHENNEAILDHLWVRPDFMGHGIGKRLFLHVAAYNPAFVFTSDPHADNFYIRMGAQKIGEHESALQGRMLTRFRYATSSG